MKKKKLTRKKQGGSKFFEPIMLPIVMTEKSTPEEISEQLNIAFKESQDKYEELKTDLATKEELEKAAKLIEKNGKALQDFIDANRTEMVKDFMSQFGDFLTEKKDELDKIAKSKSGTVEFVPKAVGDISTVSGGDLAAAPINHNTRLSNVNLRNDNKFIDLCTQFSTNKESFAYTEVTPKEGGYGFVAEGAVKPQIDFKWENRYATPVKIAAYEILTEESVTDRPRLMSVAKDFLKKKHDLFKADGLYFGAGGADEATGATVTARTFVAGAMALKIPTGKVNFMHVVNAIITDIYTTQNYVDEMQYMPSVVMINPVDFFLELSAAVDGDGLPLYPSAGLFQEVSIGGIKIIPWAKIPAGKIFVADMSKYNITNYVPYSVRIGWINDQFITNKFTILGESRFHAFIRNLDELAFVYDDIATVRAAIEI